MAIRLNLEKSKTAEIEAHGMILTISLEENTERILATIESEKGGQNIRIAPHEEIKNTIYFTLEKPGGLHIVK